jgi:hypothetical protein
MEPIKYDITPVQQATAECLQTATYQVLSWFQDNNKTLSDLTAEVQVSVDANGNKLGTSIGHMATYVRLLGYKVTLHIFDVELFDRSWSSLSGDVLVDALKKRAEALPENHTIANVRDTVIPGYIAFLEYGGLTIFPVLSSHYLYSLLQKGPYVAIVNSTYLNGSPRKKYNPATDKYVDDAIHGQSLNHAVTIAGYQDSQFNIIDPEPPTGHEATRWIPAEHLIASIATAQTESDNMLITIEKEAPVHPTS